MTFTQQSTVTPEIIADISLEAFDGDIQRLTYSIQVVMSDGTTTVKSGNAVPHLSEAQISALQALMIDLREKAQGIL